VQVRDTRLVPLGLAGSGQSPSSCVVLLGQSRWPQVTRTPRRAGLGNRVSYPERGLRPSAVTPRRSA
jgi:hypothetical protein